MIKIENLILHKFINYNSHLNLVSFQIARDGTLLLIETNADEEDFLQPRSKRDWIIRLINEKGIQTVELKDVTIIPNLIDIFTDGSLLIAQSWCPKRGDYIVKNAKRYNLKNELLDEFTLGNGINFLQIDDTDTIWVGYSDEGVFGNRGWDKPMGRDGLIAYSKNGKKLWGAKHYAIADCYALNVINSKEVYFYYYADYKLVKLTDMKESACFQVEGEDTLEQFAFDEKGLIGEIDLFTMMRFQIQGNSIIPKEELQLTDEKGNPLTGTRLLRGNRIYVIEEEGIFLRKL